MSLFDGNAGVVPASSCIDARGLLAAGAGLAERSSCALPFVELGPVGLRELARDFLSCLGSEA